ncbi:MAG: hypothetical protein M1481_04070 [Candidatus Thermoplasmatota archaeon]|nr:hypothetical protein [Candidatus Thermoplasmatota archaeon]MCL5963197.1 hypothetical protein [Candidatus Thermoplasmatota archaeon]
MAVKTWRIGNKNFRIFHFYFMLIAFAFSFIPFLGTINIERYPYPPYTIIESIWIIYLFSILLFYIIQIKDIPYRLESKGNSLIIYTLLRHIHTFKNVSTLIPVEARSIEMKLLYKKAGILTIEYNSKKAEFLVDYDDTEMILK